VHVDRLAGAVARVRRHPEQLAERDQADRGEGAAARDGGAEGERRSGHAGTGAARLPQAQRQERDGRQQGVEARLRVSRQELQADDRRQARAGEQVRSAHQAIREQQQPRDQGPDAEVRVDDPRHRLQVQREDEPGQQRAPEAHAERRPRQHEGPERGDPELHHPDPAEGRGKRQDVRRQAVGREDRRLQVRQERPARDDVRVPELDVREMRGVGAQEQLQVLGRVTELAVAGPGQLGGLVGQPGRLEPERVPARERLAGQQPRAEEDDRDDGVEERRGDGRAPAQGRHQGGASRRRRRPTTTAATMPISASRLMIHPIRQLSGS
jgi:hypothetical protein